MNKQRKVLITITYNEMGIIIDTKAEEVAQPDRWIPCSERLPEERHDVLITKESFKIKGYEQEVIKAKRSVDPRSGKIEWWSPEFGTLANKAVLAWMPLPEPYTREGEEVMRLTDADLDQAKKPKA